MRFLRRASLAIGTLAIGLSATEPACAQGVSELSVLTYNVEGLPWPVRTGRDADLARITQRLQELRHTGSQPHIIVLEEAFSDAAQAIPIKAGYRFIADGPAASDAGAPATLPADRAFLAQASFLSGETWGKWRGSGLRIASDYPILAVKRAAYPAYACAGMDCLANKGVLLVTVAVPGAAQPVVIVATHLNSRRAAGVSFERSFYAYRRQVDFLTDFVRNNVASGMPLIVAGDFNAGQEPQRRAYLLRQAETWRATAPVQAALDTCLEARTRCATQNGPDLLFSQQRGRDWQLFASGQAVSLALKSMCALFGHDAQGRMLSDHVGYAATYRIEGSRIQLASAGLADGGAARLR